MWQVVSDLHKLSTELALADLKSRAPTAEATAFKLPGGEGGGNYASFDLDDGADGGEYGAIQAAGNAARALLVWGSLGRGLAVGLANHTCDTARSQQLCLLRPGRHGCSAARPSRGSGIWALCVSLVHDGAVR